MYLLVLIATICTVSASDANIQLCHERHLTFHTDSLMDIVMCGGPSVQARLVELAPQGNVHVQSWKCRNGQSGDRDA